MWEYKNEKDKYHLSINDNNFDFAAPSKGLEHPQRFPDHTLGTIAKDSS